MRRGSIRNPAELNFALNFVLLVANMIATLLFLFCLLGSRGRSLVEGSSTRE